MFSMKESELEFAGKIRANEVNDLLVSFWGKDNPLAQYSDPLFDFETANSILKSALLLPKDLAKSKVSEVFSGKTISLGLRKNNKLVAHSGVILYPTGEIETAGSIISEEYKGMALMDEINLKKKDLIKDFALLGFQPASSVLLGSKSVVHGYSIFDMPDIGLATWFCNIGPYVFARPIDPSKTESGYITNLALKTESHIFSSSSQILGITKESPPLISQNTIMSMPKFWVDLLEEYPKKETNLEPNASGFENSIYDTKANIVLHTIRQPIKDIRTFITNVSNSTLSGKTNMLKVPLSASSELVLEQVGNLLRKSDSNIEFIPTGLTVVNGYWSICISSIPNERVEHYTGVMTKVAGMYEGSLKNLAITSYKYLTNTR